MVISYCGFCKSGRYSDCIPQGDRMNNPTILDIALGFILHKRSRDEFGRRNNKAQAIREMNDEELTAVFNEIVAQQEKFPRTVRGWKEWLIGGG